MRFLITMFFLSMFFFSIAQNDTAVGVKWVKGLSWEQIKAVARAENKYIFVDAYTTWCGPCKLMDQQVYSRQSVSNALEANFLAVKVQMDQTPSDDIQVKNWYKDAEYLAKNYNVIGYPTLLFFSPDAKPVHSELGFKNARDFVRIIQLARDPKKPLLYGLYEDFKSGKKVPISGLGELAIFTQRLIGDKESAQTMAKEYKLKYLDKLKGENGLIRETFDFLLSFNNLLRPDDKYFKLCYNKPGVVDSIMRRPGGSKRFVNRTITDYEINSRLFKDNKPISKYPDWKKIEEAIVKKYTKIDAGRLVVESKMYYYRTSFPDWQLWADAVDEKITRYPPSLPGTDTIDYVHGDLNTRWAWGAFLGCDDTVVLDRALSWIELAIKLRPFAASLYDTKANLLYKLGRREEALPVELEAVQLEKKWAESNNQKPSSGILNAYEKMLNNEPTWPHVSGTSN